MRRVAKSDIERDELDRLSNDHQKPCKKAGVPIRFAKQSAVRIPGPINWDCLPGNPDNSASP